MEETIHPFASASPTSEPSYRWKPRPSDSIAYQVPAASRHAESRWSSDSSEMDNTEIPNRYSSSSVSSASSSDLERSVVLCSRKTVLQSGGTGSPSKIAHIILKGQSNESDHPLFGSNDIVNGTVVVDKSERIISVEVKVEGSITVDQYAGHGSRTVEVLSDHLAWWQGDSGSCPSTIPFHFQIPSTYFCEGRERSLPPTFQAKSRGVPGFTTRVEYAIVVNVVQRNTGLWQSRKELFATINYRSQSKLLGRASGLLEELEKTTRQFIIPSKNGSTQPVVCQLTLPGSFIMPIGQPIPFRLRMTSDPQAMSKYTPASIHQSSFFQFDKGHRSGISLARRAPGGSQAVIRLYIERRITVHTCSTFSRDQTWNRTLSKTEHGGEATFRQVRMGRGQLEWIGELTPTAAEPGFDSSGLCVGDTLILSVIPPDPTDSALEHLRVSIPIQLTID